jgi:hypothetical protein
MEQRELRYANGGGSRTGISVGILGLKDSNLGSGNCACRRPYIRICAMSRIGISTLRPAALTVVGRTRSRSCTN